MRAINFRFINFAELATLVQAGQDEQDIPLAKCCGSFQEGEWVLVNFTVGGPAGPCSELPPPAYAEAELLAGGSLASAVRASLAPKGSVPALSVHAGALRPTSLHAGSSQSGSIRPGALTESTAIAGCVVDRGYGLRIAFEDRDWDTLFDFALEQPVESAPPSIPPPPTAETVSMKGTPILVVDSDRDTQAVVGALLRAAGYEVLLASSAEAAFDVLRVSVVDLVMVEWTLPGMSGLQLCERIRLDRRLSELPVMFLSTHSSNDRVQRAFEAGADDYVTKPFREAELSARIACMLRRSRLAQTA